MDISVCFGITDINYEKKTYGSIKLVRMLDRGGWALLCKQNYCAN